MTNDGNLTITDITVTDELTGDEWALESLAPSESKEYTASYTVTEADILAGKVVNVATGKGTSPDPKVPDVPVEPGDVEDPIEDPAPHLTTVKTTTSKPAVGDTYALGETITYEITVTNDGNLTITDITVIDTVEGYESVPVGTIESLAPGDSMTFEFAHVVTEQDILTGTETESGYVKNVAVADCKNASEKPTETESGTTEDKVDPENPEIILSKVITNSTGKPYGFNKEIEYLVTIENMGNVSVTDIVIEDVLTSGANPNGLSESLVLEELLGVTDKITLKPGDMITATYTYTTQDGDFRPPYQADGVTVNEHWVKNEAKAVGVASNDAAVESNPDNAETQVEQWYQAIFIDSRTNEVIDIVRVPYGGNITAPDVPEHRGYDFIRWTDWFWENVTFNQTIYALYERDTETIYDAKIPLAGGYISNVGDCFD